MLFFSLFVPLHISGFYKYSLGILIAAKYCHVLGLPPLDDTFEILHFVPRYILVIHFSSPLVVPLL